MQKLFQTIRYDMRFNLHKQALSYIWRWRYASDGSTGVEFSLIALPLFGLIFAIFEAAFVFYVEHDMQRVVNEFAVNVRSGKIQMNELSAETAKRTYFCSKLTFSMVCENMQLTLRPQPDCVYYEYCWYYAYGTGERWNAMARMATNFDAGDTVSPGWNWQPVILSLAYPLPTITTIWSSSGAVTRDGKLVRAIVANAIWVFDPYTQKTVQ